MARLADLTTLRVGGPARRLVQADDAATLVAAIREADRAGEPLLLVAGGSNLLVADAGFAGTVVHVRSRGVATSRDGDAVVLEITAGEPWDDVVALAVELGLAGIECLAGIPGSTGATPVQNVGAYGQEIAETLREVRVLDRATGAVGWLPAAACGLGYRTSAFKGSTRHVILAVRLALVPAATSRAIRYAELARAVGVEQGATAPLPTVRQAVLDLRRGKGMVLDPVDHDTWSAGSFFTNPVLAADAFATLAARADAAGLPAPPAWREADGRVKTSAAWLIERAGFAKGHGLPGPAALSTKHTLALTNRGGATAEDLLALARTVRSGVAAVFGVTLVPEPVLVGCAL